MFISFFTSRILLEKLGVEDYGIYNVVGSVVAIFASIQSLLASSTQRFLNYEHGIGNTKKLRDIFSMSVLIHILLCAIFLVLILPIGLYIINNFLVIPENRLVAANWVFVFSILTVLVSIMTVPYNAVIIANERMNAFAYISIVDGLLKLLVIYLLIVTARDHLIVYAVLLFVSALLVRIINIIYCKRNFQEAKDIRFKWDKELLKKMGSFAGWQFVGNTGWSIQNQGVDMVINIFFGPTLNAAKSVANQVNAGLAVFVNNMMTAINPRLTKLYASNNLTQSVKLFYLSSKFSVLIFAILSFPFFLNTELLIGFWLKSIPPSTILLVKWVIVTSLLRMFHSPINSMIQSTGNIKKYQQISFMLMVLVVPIVYLFFNFKYPIQYLYIISIVLQSVETTLAFIILKGLCALKVSDYLKKVLLPSILVIIIYLILGGASRFNLIDMYGNSLFTTLFLSMIFSVVSLFIIISKEEFKYLKHMLKK